MNILTLCFLTTYDEILTFNANKPEANAVERFDDGVNNEIFNS
jgi:hypothetical protein